MYRSTALSYRSQVAAVGPVLADESVDVDVPEDPEDDVLEEDEPELCSTL
jgi:hypothetical protein